MNGRSWFAIILIAFGVVLLLDQMHIIYFSARDLLTYGFMVFGLGLLVSAYKRTDRKGILGGVFFLTYGLILTLMRNRVFVRDDEFGFGTFFLCLALANLVYFMFRNERWTNFAWGIIFGAFGGALLLSHYGYFSRWYIYDNIERFWPVALILLGAAIIYKGYKMRENHPVRS